MGKTNRKGDEYIVTKIGVLLPTRESVMYHGTGDPRPLVQLAIEAETAGYDSVWAGDSLLAKPRAEPLTFLAAVAAATERVELGTAVLIASQRNPEQLAQAVATLDALSGGRFILGVGAGPGADNVRVDHEFVGANFDKRSSRVFEVTERCRALWAADNAPQMYPLPHRPSGPPIWMGGEGPRTLERTGRLADGWFPITPDVPTFVTKLAAVRASAEAAGRDPNSLDIAMYLTVVVGETATAEAALAEHSELYYNKPASEIASWQAGCAGPVHEVVEFIHGFIDAGADHICVRFATRDVSEQVHLLAEHLPDLRS